MIQFLKTVGVTDLGCLTYSEDISYDTGYAVDGVFDVLIDTIENEAINLMYDILTLMFKLINPHIMPFHTDWPFKFKFHIILL